MGITGVTVRLLGVICRLTKYPDPPSRLYGKRFRGYDA